MTPWEVAYWAGIFDGEGSVIIYLGKDMRPRRYGPCDREWYRLRATVTNTCLRLLEAMKKSWGGHILKKPLRSSRHRQTWVWIAVTQQAAAFLSAVLPYLIVKASEARIGLALNEAIQREGFHRTRRLSTIELSERRLLFNNLLAARREPFGFSQGLPPSAAVPK